jgi:mRNA-degrading endonuclease HigB of HigAB toxin-antitoxin module
MHGSIPSYRAGVLYIKFVGTHAAYDQINVAAVER